MDNGYGPGFIYLIRRSDGWFKIGRTANPEERFRSIRWQYGRNRGAELVLLCMCRVHRQADAERLFHRIFADKRSEEHHRGLGPRIEWFILDPDDLSKWRLWADIIADEVLYLNITLTDDDWLDRVRKVPNG